MDSLRGPWRSRTHCSRMGEWWSEWKRAHCDRRISVRESTSVLREAVPPRSPPLGRAKFRRYLGGTDGRCLRCVNTFSRAQSNMDRSARYFAQLSGGDCWRQHRPGRPMGRRLQLVVRFGFGEAGCQRCCVGRRRLRSGHGKSGDTGQQGGYGCSGADGWHVLPQYHLWVRNDGTIGDPA